MTVVLAGIVGFGIYRHTTSGQSAYALSVNGKHFSPGDIATRVSQSERFATALAYDPSATPNTPGNQRSTVGDLVRQEVEIQEAQRRGLTCTQPEASSAEATQIATAEKYGDQDLLLAAAASFGIVPPDYIATPEALRTPATSDAIAAYIASPGLAAATLRNCEAAKLLAQVRAQAKANGRNDSQAEATVIALNNSLIQDASVDGPALTVTPPTPDATPTP
jgi:hypothetical protein